MNHSRTRCGFRRVSLAASGRLYTPCPRMLAIARNESRIQLFDGDSFDILEQDPPTPFSSRSRRAWEPQRGRTMSLIMPSGTLTTCSSPEFSTSLVVVPDRPAGRVGKLEFAMYLEQMCVSLLIAYAKCLQCVDVEVDLCEEISKFFRDLSRWFARQGRCDEAGFRLVGTPRNRSREKRHCDEGPISRRLEAEVGRGKAMPLHVPARMPGVGAEPRPRNHAGYWPGRLIRRDPWPRNAVNECLSFRHHFRCRLIELNDHDVGVESHPV